MSNTKFANASQGKPLVVPPEERRRALNVIGVEVVVLASPAEAPRLQSTLQSGAEGAGPPPHSHGWDEVFFVVRGDVTFTCDGKETVCKPGSFIHVPANTVHGYRFGPGGGELFEVTGSGSGAVEMFREVDRSVPPGPPDVPRLVELLRKKGVNVSPP